MKRILNSFVLIILLISCKSIDKREYDVLDKEYLSKHLSLDTGESVLNLNYLYGDIDTLIFVNLHDTPEFILEILEKKLNFYPFDLPKNYFVGFGNDENDLSILLIDDDIVIYPVSGFLLDFEKDKRLKVIFQNNVIRLEPHDETYFLNWQISRFDSRPTDFNMPLVFDSLTPGLRINSTSLDFLNLTAADLESYSINSDVYLRDYTIRPCHYKGSSDRLNRHFSDADSLILIKGPNNVLFVNKISSKHSLFRPFIEYFFDRDSFTYDYVRHAFPHSYNVKNNYRSLIIDLYTPNLDYLDFDVISITMSKGDLDFVLHLIFYLGNINSVVTEVCSSG